MNGVRLLVPVTEERPELPMSRAGTKRSKFEVWILAGLTSSNDDSWMENRDAMMGSVDAVARLSR